MWQAEPVWFGWRWKVYALGHLEGDRMWLATFRYECHAKAMVDRLAGYRNEMRGVVA